MRSTAWDLGGKVRFRFAPLRMTRARVISDAVPDCYRERKQKRASRFILSLVDPDAPPYGFASLFEFDYGLRPPLRMTRGRFGETTIGERAGSWRRLTATGSCRRLICAPARTDAVRPTPHPPLCENPQNSASSFRGTPPRATEASACTCGALCASPSHRGG